MKHFIQYGLYLFICLFVCCHCFRSSSHNASSFDGPTANHSFSKEMIDLLYKQKQYCHNETNKQKHCSSNCLQALQYTQNCPKVYLNSPTVWTLPNDLTAGRGWYRSSKRQWTPFRVSQRYWRALYSESNLIPITASRGRPKVHGGQKRKNYLSPPHTNKPHQRK